MTDFPEVIAHRGSSQEHAGNSWAAFEAALAEGADTIECDVVATADSQLAVRHDLTVAGTRVIDLDLRELRRRAPETVEAAALIDWAAGHGLGLLLELKDTASVAIISRLIDRHRTDRLTVGGFNGPSLRRLREGVPHVATSLMIGTVMGAEEMAYLARRYGCQGVHPCWERRDHEPHRLLDPGDVARLRNDGLKITLWHEEREEQLLGMIALGADAICTDCPATLRALLSRDLPV